MNGAPDSSAVAAARAGAGPVLAASAICKKFGRVVALDGVDLTLNSGEILALMGENGAGKSTLIKCLTGVHRADSGRITLAGREISPGSPRDAELAGISTVYQEVNLIPHMTVAENICLGREPTVGWQLGRINWRRVKQRARDAASRVGISVDVDSELGTCSTALQQLIAIARALDVNSRVLILDEPTSSLDRAEVEALFGVLRRLRSQGLAIVFVTHFLEQVYAISDRIMVLRDGRVVGNHASADLGRERLVSLMIGREFASSASRAHEPSAEHAQPLLEAKGIARRGALNGVDISIGRGEVVGLAGLLGSGRTETARALFGADPPEEGEITMNGSAVSIRSPRAAISRGIGMTPENRKADGILPSLSVHENIILVLQARAGIGKHIGGRRTREIAAELVRSIGIKTEDIDTPISHLSGGNQQKAILARWIAARPALLILDEPTRGIDIGAKVDILAQVRALRGRGISVVFISSELAEVLQASDRVVVLRDRKTVGELAGASMSEAAVLNAITAGHE